MEIEFNLPRSGTKELKNYGGMGKRTITALSEKQGHVIIATAAAAPEQAIAYAALPYRQNPPLWTELAASARPVCCATKEQEPKRTFAKRDKPNGAVDALASLSTHFTPQPSDPHDVEVCLAQLR